MGRSPFLLFLMALCALLAGCRGLVSGPSAPATTPSPVSGGGLDSVQHIIFMSQENRSFDHYFGKLNDYRASQGIAQDVDGLPANAMNLAFKTNVPIAAYHLQTMCVENLSPAWDESHRDVNRDNPRSGSAKMDGFAYSAGNFATNEGLHDVEGRRAMGFYDSSDLPFYYFMASEFATSDRWFSPL